MKNFALFIGFIAFISSFATHGFAMRVVGSCHDNVFSLEISTSFHGQVTFSLCESQESKTLRVKTLNIVYEENNKKSVMTEVTEIKDLTDESFDKIVAMYEEALAFNTLDNPNGLDGSTWCIKTYRGMNDLKACFWTPGSNTESRGLSGLYSLGEYLWDVANLKNNKQFQFY